MTYPTKRSDDVVIPSPHVLDTFGKDKHHNVISNFPRTPIRRFHLLIIAPFRSGDMMIYEIAHALPIDLPLRDLYDSFSG